MAAFFVFVSFLNVVLSVLAHDRCLFLAAGKSTSQLWFAHVISAKRERAGLYNGGCRRLLFAESARNLHLLRRAFRLDFSCAWRNDLLRHGLERAGAETAKEPDDWLQLERGSCVGVWTERVCEPDFFSNPCWATAAELDHAAAADTTFIPAIPQSSGTHCFVCRSYLCSLCTMGALVLIRLNFTHEDPKDLVEIFSTPM